MDKNSTTKLEVFAGVCGFTTLIEVTKKEDYNAIVSWDTGCPNFKKVAIALGNEPLDVMDELFKDSRVLAACKGKIPHVSCPVPAAILKALEVGVGLALPCDPTITFKK